MGGVVHGLGDCAGLRGGLVLLQGPGLPRPVVLAPRSDRASVVVLVLEMHKELVEADAEHVRVGSPVAPPVTAGHRAVLCDVLGHCLRLWGLYLIGGNWWLAPPLDSSTP